jgi:hypothetical protein
MEMKSRQTSDVLCAIPTVRALPGSTAHPSAEAWPTPSATARERSVVVLPSRTVDRWHEPPAETRAYEERLLSFLFELRDPRLRMTYVTSSRIAPQIVDYYLALLPPGEALSVRGRLTFIALDDDGPRPLSEKLLERARVLERIRRTIRDPERSYMLPYNSTVLERDVALALDIPVYGADPVHARLGTKSGCRELFALTGVPHPRGEENVRSVADAGHTIARLRAANPRLAEVVMKLNVGVSGEGNAIIDLADLPEPGAPDERPRIAQRVREMAPEMDAVTAAAYLVKLGAQGGVVEERITGLELRSPSVQLQISPAGQVEVLSTHDQILNGRSGQSYAGCRFPADPAYAPVIGALARRVAEHLASLGVIGRFAIDFLVARGGDRRWQPFAVELNLRMGGTTHPYQTVARLTGGQYDTESGGFSTPQGEPRHYVATDHLEVPELRRIGRDGVLALARRREIGFDGQRGAGAVFHMLSAIEELGYVGLTAIADTAERAGALYEHVEATLARLGGDVCAAA